MSIITSSLVNVVIFKYAWWKYEDLPNHMLIITSSLVDVFVFVYAWRELLVNLNV